MLLSVTTTNWIKVKDGLTPAIELYLMEKLLPLGWKAAAGWPDSAAGKPKCKTKGVHINEPVPERD